MKKLLLIATLISTVSTFAQNGNAPCLLKNDWLVGGHGRYSSTSYSGDADNDVNTFRIMADGGYFFMDRFAAGLRAGFSSVKQPSFDAFTNFKAAPFLRYYFLPAKNKINLLADASYGIGSRGSDEKESYNKFEFMGGPVLFLNRNTALEGLGFYKGVGGDAYDPDFHSFGFKAGFQVHLDCDSNFKWTPDILQNDWLVDGCLEIESSDYADGDFRHSQIRFNPQIGYGFIDKGFGGVRLDYLSERIPYGTTKETFSEFSLTPFVRYYFLPAKQHTNLFADVSYGFGSYDYGTKESFNYFGVMAGPAFFLSEYTSLEVTAGYRTYGGEAYPDAQNTWSIGFGLQIHLDGKDKVMKK